MSEAIHISAGPFTIPPPGSNLKRLVDKFDAEARSSSLPDTLGGCVALWAEELILRRLVRLGMPQELANAPPAWLLDTIALQAAYLRVDAPIIDEKKLKVGRPAYPNVTASLIGYAEYLRQAAIRRAESENAVYVATAKALGPGIDRHHVGRLVKYHAGHLRRLKTSNPYMHDGYVKSCLTFVESLDEISGPLTSVVLESSPKPAFSRTESRRTSASARTR